MIALAMASSAVLLLAVASGWLPPLAADRASSTRTPRCDGVQSAASASSSWCATSASTA